MQEPTVKDIKTPNSIDYYTNKTIESWDEVAPRHASFNSSLLEDVSSKNFNNLNPDFNALVDNMIKPGHCVVQICCNNGIDLLSVKNKGAGRCLGIDGSKEFITQAVNLANASLHNNVEYCHSNIYSLPKEHFQSFDVAIITVGVMNWMPDIARFMQACASLIKPGGILLVEEIHPILGMYEEGEPSFIDASYFNSEPYVDTNGLDYFGNEKYSAKENFWFHHSLADILMGAIASGLQLEHMKELPYNVGNFCADLETTKNNPPLGINFAWRKSST